MNGRIAVAALMVVAAACSETHGPEDAQDPDNIQWASMSLYDGNRQTGGAGTTLSRPIGVKVMIDGAPRAA